jgi:ZIP family zinc transporter
MWWAGLWGGVAGAALLVGSLIGLYAGASSRVIGWVMAVGAGVLISSVAFELMDQAYRSGGFLAVAGGAAAGAVSFSVADWAVARRGGARRKRSSGQPQADVSGAAIAVGAPMDGIPESIAIGTSLLHGGHVSAVMVAAVFLSNIPESMSSAAGMRKAGHSTRFILALWTGVVLISAASAMAGNALLAGAPADVLGAMQAFAGGAILAMLASTMMPEAFAEGGAVVGLVTTLGFIAAFMLSKADG